ncbi:flagellar motor switch protein FliM [Niveibacterium sp. SC-1]|uniref:flagellar motor switch protein FliM n=1 Tax=Niveibacterium sp. SC-1 TaxID=3135646 RepID=UPI00311F06F9
MAQDFLSQEEVDALLRGVTGDVDEPDSGEGEAGGIRTYNLATQERIVRGRMPTMELINERFARNLRIGLFNFMHRNAEVSVGPIKVQKYSEFVRNLVVPTNLNLILAKPLRGTGLVVFDPNLVFLVVDNMFGGDGRFHTRVEGRDFTATEQRIIQGLLKVVFSEMEKAWAPVFNLQFEYVRSEMNPQFANVATPSEIVIGNSYQLEFGGASAEMHFCLPYSTVEPIRDLLYSSMQSDHLTHDKRWVGLLSKQIHSIDLDVAVDLGKATLTLRDVLQFKPGDVIPIDIPELVTGHVDGVPAFEGHHGVSGGRYAVRVERLVPPEDREINLISMKLGGHDG